MLAAKQHPARILLIEDNPGDARLVALKLEEDGVQEFALEHVTRLADAEGRLEDGGYDAALVDLGLPDSSGLDTLISLHAARSDLPLVVLSGLDDDDMRRRAIELGAIDWVCKDALDGYRLARCLESAVARARLADALVTARRHAEHSEARLMEFIVDAFEPIVVLSESRHVLFANPAAGNALGMAPDRLIGRHLPLPVGQDAKRSVPAVGMPGFGNGSLAVRSFRIRWNHRPAWVVALDQGPRADMVPPMHQGVAATPEAISEIAAEASEIQARTHLVDASVAAAADRLEKALDVLRGWSHPRSTEDCRALLEELLESTAGTLSASRQQLDTVDRTAAQMIRAVNRGRRLRERRSVDVFVERACERARTRLPEGVELRVRARTPSVLTSDGEKIAAVTEELIVGVAMVASKYSPGGVDLRLETRPLRCGVTLSVVVEARERRPEVGASIVEALVAQPHRAHDSLAAATRGIRALDGDVRLGERRDGGIWIELRLP